jgi:hypothetical protein
MSQNPNEINDFVTRSIRIPLDLWQYLVDESTKNHRSTIGEIVHRLEQSRGSSPVLADRAASSRTAPPRKFTPCPKQKSK